MGVPNVSLSDELKSYVDEQVGDGGYGSTSEDVRDLIRRDKDRQHLRRVLLDGLYILDGCRTLLGTINAAQFSCRVR